MNCPMSYSSQQQSQAWDSALCFPTAEHLLRMGPKHRAPFLSGFLVCTPTSQDGNEAQMKPWPCGHSGNSAQEVTGFGLKDLVPLTSVLRGGGEVAVPKEPQCAPSPRVGNPKVSLVSQKASLCPRCPDNPHCSAHPPPNLRRSHGAPISTYPVALICQPLPHGPGDPTRSLPAWVPVPHLV